MPSPTASDAVAPAATTATPAPLTLSGPAALVAQQLATAPAAGQPASPIATAGAVATPTSGTTAPSQLPSTPSPLVGLTAGDRVLVRVLALLPPVGGAADGGAAVTGATTAALNAAATRATAAGAATATLADVETPASVPNSGAAQLQTAALSQAGARVGQAPAAGLAAVLAQAATGTNAPVAAGAVQPIVRAAAGPALTADPPPVAPAIPAASAPAAPPAAAAPTPTPAPTPGAAVPSAPAPTAAVGTTAAPTAAQAEAAANAAAVAAETEAAPPTTPFEASVVGTSTNGQPILLAGQTLLTLRTASVPTGSTVVLQLAAAARPAATAPLPTMSATTLPSLSELVRAAQTVGGAAQAAVTAVVPQPGPALAGQILFYLSALNQGDIKAWIGDGARTAIERAGRGATLTKLSGELKQASDSATRTTNAGEWRAQPPIPMSNGAAIQPIQLYLHRTNPDESGGEGGKSGGKPTRFLLDLNLSQLGTIQLDGLAQPPRFDLILRSAQPLSDAVRTDLRQLFADMTSARGLTGTVSFQVAPPIVPNVAPPAPRPGILV